VPGLFVGIAYFVLPVGFQPSGPQLLGDSLWLAKVLLVCKPAMQTKQARDLAAQSWNPFRRAGTGHCGRTARPATRPPEHGQRLSAAAAGEPGTRSVRADAAGQSIPAHHLSGTLPGYAGSGCGLPREIVKIALRYNAAVAILVHNHPSGLAEASATDIALTRQLREALALVDVRLADHCIVAGATVVSMSQSGDL